MGENAIAVGAKTIVNGDSGVGIGYGAVVDQSAFNGIAIGSNAQVNHATSIALGSNSQTTVGAQSSYTAYNMDTPQTSVGEVSVGSGDGQRQITNVAAGSADTDAVNVGQLKVTDSRVAANTESINNLNTGLATLILASPISKTLSAILSLRGAPNTSRPVQQVPMQMPVVQTASRWVPDSLRLLKTAWR